MHEIITLSISQRANHLTTQFFNVQDALLYSSESKINDHAVFLDPNIDKISKTVTYSPRALLWDAKTGNGSMSNYEYSKPEDHFDFDNSENATSGNVMYTHPRIEKSEYQIALDSNKLAPKLNVNNTKYWSDYSRLVYHSKTFNALNDWYHDTGNPNIPDYQRLGQVKFKDYNVGYDEFRSNYMIEFFDNNLHYELERCDSLQGFNVVTDFENAWGGFSTSMLEELRNDLPKISLYTWGFNEDDPLTAKTLKGQLITKAVLPTLMNKLKATTYLAKESDLMIPLYAPPEKSNWEISSMFCQALSTVNSLFSQSDATQRRSMDYLVNKIADGEPHRNFISNIKEEWSPEAELSFYPRVKPLKNNKHSEQPHVFSECTIGNNGNDKTSPDLKTFKFTSPDTISDKCKTTSLKSIVRLSSTESCRDVFKHWHDIVTKYGRDEPDHEELKEELATMTSYYEFGWYDDEDSGDDFN